jgi:ubiquinone/menaquinone biosynthesis C-methylase UbiE
MARIQRALAQCQDAVVRRTTILQALQPIPGGTILEVGCGGGLYAYEVAQCVGSSGRVRAIDISDDQINAAREQCANFDWVDCQTMHVLDMSFADTCFDAIYSVHVLEYVPAVDDALRQIARVLKPGGRLIIYATNWSSIVWYSHNHERMKRVLEAWDQHAPYTDFPTTLSARLRDVRLQPIKQQAVPIMNRSYHQNGFSYWLARGIRLFAVGRGLIDQAEIEAWMSAFDALEEQGAYFFCFTPIITEAIKLT